MERKIKAPTNCLVVTLFVLFISSTSSANEQSSESKSLTQLLELSLAELLNVRVVSALTDLANEKRPASVTVITAEDIRLTPARNISDLIEVYLPGAFYTLHAEEAHPGIRGIISDRNYNLLLLLNGRNLNQKSHNGAFTEIDLWELSDIHRIEIIRGPGSVIHGPGAIAGIINIVTHDAQSAEGLQTGIHYKDQFDSTGIYASYGRVDAETEGNDFYLYCSIVKNSGHQQPVFLIDSYREYPADHYSDFDDTPQIKLHADFNWGKHWNIWTRYTQISLVKGTVVPKVLVDGKLENDDHFQKRQFTFTIDHNKELKNGVRVKSSLGFESLDVEDQALTISDNVKDTINLRANFREEELLFKTLMTWDPSDRIKAAAGFEYAHERLGRGWGDGSDEMILGDGRNIISGPDSIFYQTKVSEEDALFAGSGWSLDTYAFLGEINFTQNNANTFLISGRSDQNNLTSPAFSPRLAWIRQLNPRRYVKAIMQRSVRYSTLEQLWAQKQIRGQTDAPSTMNGFELILDDRRNQHHFSSSLFYTDAELAGYSTRDRESRNLGRLKLSGIELEFTFNWTEVKLGVSHSYVKLIDWNLTDDQPKSGISYGDYNQQTDGFYLQGRGNSLNNWSHHGSKLIFRWSPNERYVVHIDSRLLWGFDGALDGLDESVAAAQGTALDEEAQARRDAVINERGYEEDFRLNASFTYYFARKNWVQIYVQNLFGLNDNKRYHQDTGNIEIPFDRAKWVEEPRYIAVRTSWQF